MNRSAAEFMQYRKPVGAGPSSNRWPRCESPCFERTSVRSMRSERSDFCTMFDSSSGLVKLGQPVPESNLSWELNSTSPDMTST
jgi:hypothetical protein